MGIWRVQEPAHIAQGYVTMRNNSPGEAESILNARNITYSDFMRNLNELHDRVKSWRFVGEVLGVSGAYARLIAQGHRVAGQSAVLRWIEYRAVSKSERPKRQRPPVWRPMLSLELKALCAQYEIDIDAELWNAVKRSALAEQWKERDGEV